MLVAPTVHGNLIVGPNAVVRRDPDDTSDTAAGLAEVRQKAVRTVPGVDFRQNIRNFAGMRANSTVDDFILIFAAAHFPECGGHSLSRADFCAGHLPIMRRSCWPQTDWI